MQNSIRELPLRKPNPHNVDNKAFMSLIHNIACEIETSADSKAIKD